MFFAYFWYSLIKSLIVLTVTSKSYDAITSSIVLLDDLAIYSIFTFLKASVDIMVCILNEVITKIQTEWEAKGLSHE